MPSLAEKEVKLDMAQLGLPDPQPLLSPQLLIWACLRDCDRFAFHGEVDGGAPLKDLWEKECKLTWFLGHPGPRAGAGAACHHLPGLHHFPVLVGSVVMLGPTSCFPGAAAWLDAQGSGHLWQPLGGSASRVVPAAAAAADHLVLFQAHGPRLSLQALFTAALLGLQSQAPVAPIGDLEGAGGRPPFSRSEGLRREVRAQHEAAFPDERALALGWGDCLSTALGSGASSGSLQMNLPELERGPVEK